MVHNVKNEKETLNDQLEKLKGLLKKELQKPKLKNAQRDAKLKLTSEEQRLIQEKVQKIVGILKTSVERKKQAIETAEFMTHSKSSTATLGVKTKKSFRTGRI